MWAKNFPTAFSRTHHRVKVIKKKKNFSGWGWRIIEREKINPSKNFFFNLEVENINDSHASRHTKMDIKYQDAVSCMCRLLKKGSKNISLNFLMIFCCSGNKKFKKEKFFVIWILFLYRLPFLLCSTLYVNRASLQLRT